MKRLLVLVLAMTGILAAGCIVRFGTFNDDTNHFVGLASNLTNVDVVAASVQVDFLNSSGSVVYTKNVSPCTRTLQKQMDSPVEADAPSSINARSVKTTVRPLTFGHKTVADLDVDEDEIAITSDVDEINIAGSIDVGDDDLEDVHVCAALFDNDDNVLAVGSDTSTTPGDIDSDGTGTFDVAIDTSDVDDVDDIDSYKLWIDAIDGNEVTAPVVIGPNDISEALHNTGDLSPSAAIGGGFTDANNAFSSDDQYATAPATVSLSQVYGNYDIGDDEVPDDANVEGIVVRLDWKADAVGDNAKAQVELSWDGGTTWTTAEADSSPSTTEETVTLGGSGEDWGHSWTTSQLTDANFQVRVTFSADVAKTFSLDWVPVTIYYTED